MIPWFDLPALPLGPASTDVPTLLAVAGVLTAMAEGRRRARRAGLSGRRAVDCLAAMLASALVFGHALDMLLYRFHELRADWQLILPWHGGYSSLGAALGAGAAAAVAFRSPAGGLRWQYLDALVPGSLAGLALLRIGCFLGHHHAGSQSSFFLAIAYPGGARHDLGLYEALLASALLVALWALERRVALAPGVAAVGIAGAYAAGRFGIEVLRGTDLEALGRHSDPRYAGLTLVQYAALLVLAAVALWLWRNGRRAPLLAARGSGAAIEQRQSAPDRGDRRERDR